MYHCLNKRRKNNGLSSKNEYEEIAQKFPQSSRKPQKEFPSYPESWRRSDVGIEIFSEDRRKNPRKESKT